VKHHALANPRPRGGAGHRTFACLECGAPGEQDHRGGRLRLFCRRACAARAASRCRENRLRAGRAGERVRRQVVAERDAWVCWLCDAPVDPALRHPNPLSASLDHVQPLSRGGTDTYENTRLAHLTCNIRRGLKVVA
jgi:hypothetical protein